MQMQSNRIQVHLGIIQDILYNQKPPQKYAWIFVRGDYLFWEVHVEQFSESTAWEKLWALRNR